MSMLAPFVYVVGWPQGAGVGPGVAVPVGDGDGDGLGEAVAVGVAVGVGLGGATGVHCVNLKLPMRVRHGAPGLVVPSVP